MTKTECSYSQVNPNQQTACLESGKHTITILLIQLSETLNIIHKLYAFHLLSLCKLLTV